MSGGPYEVVSVLPVDSTDSSTYRVKSKAEPFARAAKETDLVAVGLAPSEQSAPARWADVLVSIVPPFPIAVTTPTKFRAHLNRRLL